MKIKTEDLTYSNLVGFLDKARMYDEGCGKLEILEARVEQLTELFEALLIEEQNPVKTARILNSITGYDNKVEKVEF